MLEEVLRGLDVRSDGVYVDCTFGRGGHSTAILSRLDERGRLLVFDKDPAAIVHARIGLGYDLRVSCVQASFVTLATEVRRRGWYQKVDGVLFDLGVSSPQLEAGERGFSFLREGRLDMRFDPSLGEPAAAWINRAPEREIADVLRRYGEERYARRIAAAIARARATTPVTGAGQLRDLIAAAVPARERNKHPATRTFQAIRIFINAEIEELETALPQALDILRRNGRLIVVSFHSLEDRVVKRFMRNQARGDAFPPAFPVTATQLTPRLRIIARAIRPDREEIAANPRARSAVLRIAEKIAA